jgi:hypothetical protein
MGTAVLVTGFAADMRITMAASEARMRDYVVELLATLGQHSPPPEMPAPSGFFEGEHQIRTTGSSMKISHVRLTPLQGRVARFRIARFDPWASAPSRRLSAGSSSQPGALVP